MTLTWSLVPDGTSVEDQTFGDLGSSGLIGSLDTKFGSGPGGSNLTHRPWFRHFESSFRRWGELSGATYIYDPNDDGANAASGSPNGVLGVRGDLRIAGVSIDGSSNTLAFNNFPQNGGDMVIDTDDLGLFGKSANDFRYFRNTIMHEHGHGIGLRHLESTSDNLLMEPRIDTSFDGPQLDDVRAIQFYFGDANEKSNGGLGNGTSARATDLGSIAFGRPASVGSDANVPTQAISPTATGFVSIANLGDTDFFSFDVAGASNLTAILTPHGGQINQASQNQEPKFFDASARSDLALAIFDTNGTTLLASADLTTQGEVESLVDLALPSSGKYFARITGGDDTIQLYELKLSVTRAATFLAADFDKDGDVDRADQNRWKLAFGSNSRGDADNDGDSDGHDFLVWQRQFNGRANSSTLAVVPEPVGEALVLSTLLCLVCVGRRVARPHSQPDGPSSTIGGPPSTVGPFC